MQFDFGENWKGFSSAALTDERARSASRDFAALMEGLPLKGRSFLDIGFGQGLTLLTALELGSQAVGCDINPKCGEALGYSRRFFPKVSDREVSIVIGSILEDDTVAKLRSVNGGDGFDIVHSWGVLHHTGDMMKAIEKAASLVRPGGHFVIAIYNRHWSSSIWRAIKWTYCKAPGWVRTAMVYLAYPPIYLAKLLVTGKNPLAKERGMDFHFDVVDWVGGYPYEYASIDELTRLCEPLDLSLVRANAATVPTGCNEFVFRKRSDHNAVQDHPE